MNEFKKLTDIIAELHEIDYVNLGSLNNNQYIKSKELVKEFKDILNDIEPEDYSNASSILATEGFCNIADVLLVFSNMINTFSDEKNFVYLTAFETLYANNILEIADDLEKNDIKKIGLITLFYSIAESNIYVLDFLLDNQIDNRRNSCPTMLAIAASLNYDGDMNFHSTLISNINEKLKYILNMILEKENNVQENNNNDISNDCCEDNYDEDDYDEESDEEENSKTSFVLENGTVLEITTVDLDELDYETLILNEVIVLITNIKILELNGFKKEADNIYNTIMTIDIPDYLLDVITKLYKKPYNIQGVKMITMSSDLY